MTNSGLLKTLCLVCFFIIAPIYIGATNANKKGTKVILFIGDGMSIAQWQTGMIMNHSPLNIERMHSVGIMQTNSLTDFNGDGPSHGTAIASGINTRKGAVGVDSNNQPTKSIIEYAAEKGIMTGIVSANTLFEGSIAPFIAHVKSRMQKEDIALAYVEQTPDVFIGGGMNSFSTRNDGRNLLEELERKDYHVAKSIHEIQNIKSGKLAGFTSETNLPDILHGRGNTLTASVSSAINLLNQSNNGFFLLIGDMFMDRASHNGDTKLVGLETIDFDKAIGIALDYAEKDGNTLVIVAGGPEASGMTLVGGNEKQEPIAKWTMPGMIHTSTMVPIFSYGVGAEKFQGIIKNTDLFLHIKNILCDE